MDGKDGKALEQKNGHRLLIVEDDCLMAEGTADYFISKGWETDVAEEGDRALELLEQKSYHLILLDVMMPGMNGFSVCREIRKNSDVPIIFITARVLEEDKLNGYSMGADDYVTKPFSLPVLYAKAKALMGRIQGRIYSREQLLIRFWGYDFDGNERVVDNHIKKLRKAIGDCGCTIGTVRKSGYRMEVEA